LLQLLNGRIQDSTQGLKPLQQHLGAWLCVSPWDAERQQEFDHLVLAKTRKPVFNKSLAKPLPVSVVM
jgi:hypothetical protein